MLTASAGLSSATWIVLALALLSGLCMAGTSADEGAASQSRDSTTDDATLGNVEILQAPDAVGAADASADCLQGGLVDLLNMDTIRQTPLDVEVVSTKIQNGYKAQGIYITSQMTPEGPDRVFFYLAMPEEPASPVPVFISLTGGGDNEGFVLWAAQMLKCAVVDFEWRRPTAPLRSKWASENRSGWPVTSELTDNFGYNLVVGMRRTIDYLCQEPGIDAERIACGGGSMGGYYALVLAGADARVRCAAATYGAGAGAESEMRSAISRGLVEHLNEEQREIWIERHDPITYAPRTEGSVFMYLAANDFFFWLGDTVGNYEALPCPKRMLIVPNYNHNYGTFQTEVPENPWQVWFQSCLQGGEPFPEVTEPQAEGCTYTWTATGPHAVTASTLYWSPGEVSWPSRYWLPIPATDDAGTWRAEVPREYAGIAAQLYITAVDQEDRAVSSMPVSRDGLNPLTSVGPLWPGDALWDEARGAAAWRPTIVMVNPGPAKIVIEDVAPGRLKLGPAEGQQKFALLTNSVILASGNAQRHKGIRLIVDGKGQAGQLRVALLRESGCPDVIEYATTVEYGKGSTVVDVGWEGLRDAKGSSALPYPFDALRLDGERPDGSAIVIERLRLR